MSVTQFSLKQWFRARGCAAALPLLAACQGPSSGLDPGGTAEVALPLVPDNIFCVGVNVHGASRVATRFLDVIPGMSGSYPLAGLPTGMVTIDGGAFDVACADVTAASIPLWVGGPVSATIQPGVLTPISMTFVRNGQIDISITFEEDAPGGSGGGGTGGSGGGAGTGMGGSTGTGGSTGMGGATGMGGVAGGTEVGGILNQDATWTAAGSPYRLAHEVQVAPNVTLTIGAGASVEGGGHAITTWGTLLVEGQSGNEARFHNVLLDPAGSPAAPAVMTIDRAIIDGGRIWGSTTATYGSLTLTNSVVRDAQAGAYILLWYPQAPCTIERNVFVRSGGISVGTRGTTVTVRNNVFYRPTTASAVQNWASYGGLSTTVSRNTFLDTSAVAVEVPSQHDGAMLDARENFWSTTDPAVIAGMIFDQNDDLRSASVIPFEPFLTAPDPATPDHTPWVN